MNIINEKPLVSIITVCYNSEKSIKKTIKSVLNQTYDNIEYIIIDGGSTDNTLSIIDDFNNSNIKLVSEKDNGIYDAMNKGINIASGEIIGIINSDDWYEMNSIEIVVNEYIKNGEGIYYGIERKLINSKEFLLERGNIEFIDIKMIPHSTCFVSKSIYTNYGTFDEKYRYSADYDLIIRMKNKRVAFFKIDKIISNFSIGGASSSPRASIESIKIKYKYGFIKRKQYYYQYLKNIAKIMLKRR